VHADRPLDLSAGVIRRATRNSKRPEDQTIKRSKDQKSKRAKEQKSKRAKDRSLRQLLH
jgi:hypothetical protein